MSFPTKSLITFCSGVALCYTSVWLFSEQPLSLSFQPAHAYNRLLSLVAEAPEQAKVEPLQNKPKPAEINTRPKANPTALLQTYLEQEEYTRLLNLYEEAFKEGKEQPFVRPIFLHISERVASNPMVAKQLAVELLAIDYGNLFFHYLALDSNIELANYPQALEHLIFMRDAYVPEPFTEAVALKQKRLLQDYAQELIERSDRPALEAFIGQLEYLNELELASSLQSKLEQLTQSEYLAGLYPLQIQMTPVGNHHVVEVVLNGEVSVELLLDTGASSVAIATEVIDQLNYQMVRENVLFNSANGQHTADYVELESIRVGEVELTDFTVSTLNNYHSDKASGLLGQSFLSLFDWKVDQENHLLYLAPK